MAAVRGLPRDLGRPAELIARQRLLVAVCALALLAPASAGAQARKPASVRLAVASLGVPTGQRLDPAQKFVVRGRVVNRGRRGSRGLLAFSLRTQRPRRGLAYSLGGRGLLRVRPRRSRRFRAGLRLPAGFPVRAGRSLWLTACVRRKRGANARCRTARRPIVFAPARGTGLIPDTGPRPPVTPPPGTGPTGPGKPYFPGARSAGDRLFPGIGNGGYDVEHYDLALDFQPVTEVVLATTTITAKATQDLSEYSLDFHGLSVGSVKVDGIDATFAREGDELIVTPPAGIDNGGTFTTTVAYGGILGPYTDPDGSHEGWVTTPDGAYVVNEPVGAMSWFPNNNVPTDKALYDIKVTVPASSTVFGNGRLVSNTLSAPSRTWHWREDRPMATYLVTATNGNFVRTADVTNPDRPYEYGVDTAYGPGVAAAQALLERSEQMTDFFEDTIGSPYPFTSAGGVVDAVDDTAALYALESQTRPMYPIPPEIQTVAHEVVHQWFGNSVSPATWSDMWLNEGPAVFYSWLWDERGNSDPDPLMMRQTTDEHFDDNYEDGAIDWSVPPAQPGDASEIFNTDAMYTRGAMVMEALRQILGEAKFFEVNRIWLEEHAYSHATTVDFTELVRTRGEVDPGQLKIFFDEWLYTSYPDGDKTKPGINPDNFETYSP